LEDSSEEEEEEEEESEGGVGREAVKAEVDRVVAVHVNVEGTEPSDPSQGMEVVWPGKEQGGMDVDGGEGSAVSTAQPQHPEVGNLPSVSSSAHAASVQPAEPLLDGASEKLPLSTALHLSQRIQRTLLGDGEALTDEEFVLLERMLKKSRASAVTNGASVARSGTVATTAVEESVHTVDSCVKGTQGVPESSVDNFEITSNPSARRDFSQTSVVPSITVVESDQHVNLVDNGAQLLDEPNKPVTVDMDVVEERSTGSPLLPSQFAPISV